MKNIIPLIFALPSWVTPVDPWVSWIQQSFWQNYQVQRLWNHNGKIVRIKSKLHFQGKAMNLFKIPPKVAAPARREVISTPAAPDALLGVCGHLREQCWQWSPYSLILGIRAQEHWRQHRISAVRSQRKKWSSVGCNFSLEFTEEGNWPQKSQPTYKHGSKKHKLSVPATRAKNNTHHSSKGLESRFYWSACHRTAIFQSQLHAFGDMFEWVTIGFSKWFRVEHCNMLQWGKCRGSTHTNSPWSQHK